MNHDFSLNDMNTHVPAPRKIPGNTPMMDAEMQELMPGRIFGGKYRLEKLAGAGGMGIVWKAWDTVGERMVALKFVPAEIRHLDDAMTRVKRTFKRIQVLNHTHICPVYGLEKDTEVGFYVVMKWLEGKSLATFIEEEKEEGKSKLENGQRISILRDVAEALDYAHARGVIHRDVKPSNIFLTFKTENKTENARENETKIRTGTETGAGIRTESETEIKSEIEDIYLIDFGLASEILETMNQYSNREINTSGTRPYMPPEQWQGKSQTAQTDQYALGVVAYELFSGKRPFQISDVEMLRLAILQDVPDSIPEVSQSVNLTILRALAKNPAERFPSCTDFVNALTQMVSASATASYSYTDTYPQGYYYPGYGTPGYGTQGYTQSGHTPQVGYTQSGYTQSGYTQSGYTQSGYTQSGYTQNVENRSAHTPDEWQIMVNEITETEVHENKLSARLKFWKQKFREEEYQKKREYKILAQIIGFILIIFCGLMGTLVPEPYKEEVVILDEMEKEKEMKEVAQLSAMKCNAIRILVQEFHYKHAWINLNSLRRQKLSSDMQKELDQLEALIRYSEEYYKMVGEFLKSVPKPTKMKEGDCELAGYVNEVARFSTPTGEQIALALEKPTVGKYDLYKMVYHHYFAPELETGKRYSTLCYAALEGSREGGNRELARNLLSDIFEKGNEKERQAARLLLDEFWRENIKNDSL